MNDVAVVVAKLWTHTNTQCNEGDLCLAVHHICTIQGQATCLKTKKLT